MKSVFITGGSTGIGAACVKEFIDNGYKVAFTYNSNRDAAVSLSKLTGAVAVQWNGSEKQLEDAFKGAKVNLGVTGFSCIVSNAGVSYKGLFGRETEDDLEKIRRLWKVNYFGAAKVAKLGLPYMIEEQSGSIIFISSMWGQVGASCEVEYSATKGAVISMAKALAKEVGLSGVRVNCIAPGPINTKMNEDLDEKAKQMMENETLLGRIGEGKDVAKAVIFLASESASYITGQVIGVNGGMVV